jgi:hypothetical protein
MRGSIWIAFAIGLWLIIAGLTVGMGVSRAEEIVIGVVIAGLATAAGTRPSSALSWLVAIAGLWTLLAPELIPYGNRGTARMNDIVCGIIVLVVGVAHAISRESPVRTSR